MKKRIILKKTETKGDSLFGEFWKSPSIEELAEMQGVQPITDISVFLGTWPGDMNDGFEETIRELRHQNFELTSKI
jgi:hypothetical protein